MPVDFNGLYCGVDAVGGYWRAGFTGAKYHFVVGDALSEKSALEKAKREQAQRAQQQQQQQEE